MKALLWVYLRKRLMEASTYAGIVAALGAWLYKAYGYTLSADQQTTLIAAIVTVVGILLSLISERKGENPNNALPPPAGTSPVVTPTTANGRGAVIVQRTDLPAHEVVPVQTASGTPIPSTGAFSRRPGSGH